MKQKHLPLVEDGIVVGTGSNKYEMKNPVGRYLLYQFDRAIAELVSQINPKTILEVGCGEGHVTQILSQTNASLHCTDISDKILDIAKSRVNYSRISFEKKSIYDLQKPTDQADLVVCCEVLEHLEYPQIGLEKLASVAAPYCILSVPREPIFRTLNFLRGAYFTEFGNSPGHVQHWSRRGFIKLVKTKFEILNIKSLLPWTVILAQTK
ncbi:class I SAM-dependent methyltransferase [Gloeocapsopsis dulcis]|uniref:Methyltransferase type 11 n=1 Tax=Gloeocapsopsis dulcis AAB1 = 1H9 TaxID=1433147 RepID=A0A6N8FU96_9CHRO|nr:class I SAM-dependent methyltransferase [Gloeocapsopsis dulcis]MUL36688.1 methyltransferase type 11 [Gloeocapsopsis dulcis AAB1 = 1H9]WNN91262.1 methyltransferase domain-containing protein [Gloeocapsopsis dulcis]